MLFVGRRLELSMASSSVTPYEFYEIIFPVNLPVVIRETESSFILGASQQTLTHGECSQLQPEEPCLWFLTPEVKLEKIKCVNTNG